MLKTEGLSVLYGKKRILAPLSFHLKRGSFTAVLGKNGSGKSTLLSALGGALPYEGTILLAGEELSSLSPQNRARQIALLPQHLPAPAFTVRELAEKGRAPHLDLAFRLRKEDRAAADAALRRVGVSHLASRRLDTLSGGERQLAFLAAALAQSTPLLCLDEPTAFLDMEKESAFLETLLRLQQEEGKTVLTVMHDLAAAVRYADTVLILDGGELAFFGSTTECLDRGMIEKVFSLRRYTAHDRIFFAAT